MVSAALSDESISRRAFDFALDGGTILLSLPVLAELNEVQNPFGAGADTCCWVSATRKGLAALMRQPMGVKKCGFLCPVEHHGNAPSVSD